MKTMKEILAKSMLVESNLPDTDCVVNAYTGCEFACAYCYASFMGRFVGEPVGAWGEYVYVKTNAVEVLCAELAKLPAHKQNRTVFLSSVTDPYQGLEAKYKLTRGILEAFADANYAGQIGILTKSGMVKRDIDVLRRLKNVDVGMTVTTTDDALGRWLEVKAPRASVRLDALKALADAGLKTYAFVGPLLPHYRYRPELLEGLFEALHAAGVREIYAEHLNMKPYIMERLMPALRDEPPEVRRVYEEAKGEAHRAALDDMVLGLVAKYGMHLRLGEVIFHGQKRT